jgi:cell division protein FtsL
MAKRRVGPGRRSLIALALVGFVSVATGVIARRVYGVREQREIRTLERTRDALAAERLRLEGVIREASSRSRLQPIAEQRLNMHIPKPEQQVFLTPPSGPAPRATKPNPRPPHDSI